MKQFSGFEDAKKAAAGSSQIPVGAYVARIMATRYEEAKENGFTDSIVIQFDIAEGEHKDFFKKQYDANTSEDKLWKGKVYVSVPNDDKSEQDGWRKNTFARWTNAIEASNTGYTWDWDESKWKGKSIGLVFGPTGSVTKDGKEIVFNEVHQPCSVKEVTEGTFWKGALELKKRKGFTGQKVNNNSSKNDGSYDFVSVPAGVNEELPF